MHKYFKTIAGKKLLEYLKDYGTYRQTVLNFFVESLRLFSDVSTINDELSKLELAHIVLESRLAKWRAKKLPSDLSSYGGSALSEIFRKRMASF